MWGSVSGCHWDFPGVFAARLGQDCNEGPNDPSGRWPPCMMTCRMGDVGCWQEMLHLCYWKGGMSSVASLQRMERKIRDPLKWLFDDYAEVPAHTTVLYQTFVWGSQVTHRGEWSMHPFIKYVAQNQIIALIISFSNSIKCTILTVLCLWW